MRRPRLREPFLPAAGRRHGALYLFIPVSWYDSALWGQVDAVGALLMLAALLVLADGWSEPAMILAVLGVLVKPQDAICLVVVLPVLVRRHLLRVGSGPVPSLGRRLSALDERLGGRLTDQGPLRLGMGHIPRGHRRHRSAPALRHRDVHCTGKPWPGLPGHRTGGRFDRALPVRHRTVRGPDRERLQRLGVVGSQPLASIARGSGSWTSDFIVVFAGPPAFQVGALLLAAVCLLVVAGLLFRDDRRTIVLAFAVVAFAFYAVPTRVHERYLFPFFPAAALLTAPYLGRALAYCWIALLIAREQALLCPSLL